MSLYLLRQIRISAHPVLLPKYSTLSLHKWTPKSNHSKSFSTDSEKIREWSTWKGVITRFVPIGICLVAVMQWRAYRKHSVQHLAKQWEIKCYCALPLRVASRCWGWIADKRLPESIRPYVYGLYASSFGVNLSEAANEDLKAYPSLAEFFARSLKDGARHIDPSSCLVSPCDGTVLHYGTIHNGQVEQVKGVTYSLENFLGENTWNKTGNHKNCDYQNSLCKSDQSTTLHQCIIYLAPGDYHRFHSPAEWQPTHRRHFPGQLLSVSPNVAKWIPGLFCLNERAVYVGNWAYGFFSMTAVGATNVGSIKIYCDKMLQTNRPKYKQNHMSKDKCLGCNLELKKGDPFGEFRMGSTIVLIFEAPSNFQFSIKSGQHIKVGQSLCCETEKKYVDRVQKPKYTTNNAS